MRWPHPWICLNSAQEVVAVYFIHSEHPQHALQIKSGKPIQNTELAHKYFAEAEKIYLDAYGRIYPPFYQVADLLYGYALAFNIIMPGGQKKSKRNFQQQKNIIRLHWTFMNDVKRK